MPFFQQSLFQLTIFLASFFLFISELYLARLLLPQFGGSGHVWATCLFFFTALLTVGYFFAHVISIYLKDKNQLFLYLALLFLGALIIPFHLPAQTAANPYWGVFSSLAQAIGLPFLILSMTSPLLQNWIAGTKLPGHKNPYTLYAASNLGPLAALLLYPLLIEPFFSLKAQALFLSITYFIILALALLLLWVPFKSISHQKLPMMAPPLLPDRLTWIFLGASGTALMIAATHTSSMDIGQIPLLWAIPLVIYLLTLILSFGPRPWYPRFLPHTCFLLFIILKAWAYLIAPERNLFLSLTPLYALLFIGNMISHRRLYLIRPTDHRHLTMFYLYFSLGGALGTFLIALGIPLLMRYSPFYSFELILALLLLLAGMILQMRQELKGRLIFSLVALVLLVIGLGFFLTRQSYALLSLRNFYGQYSIYDQEDARYFLNGSTLHGKEYLHKEMEKIPLLYYRPDSPIGELFALLPEIKKVGSVGLGIGSLLAYSKPQEEWDLYELDPDVVMIAQKYFRHLEHSPAKKNFIIGDGRLQLTLAPDHSYDLLILDAFSSDAIPTHLLTLEALEIYRQKIKPQGVIAFHLSNDYLNLVRLLTFTARELNLHFAYHNKSYSHPQWGEDHAQWLVISANQTLINQLVSRKNWVAKTQGKEIRIWRDDYASILPIFLDF